MTPSPAALSSAPRLHQVGRFRLVAEIARGGMGVVYLARANDEEGREELFAVKTLLPEYAGEEQYRRMFLDEANLGVRLEHPNIVRTVEVGGSKKQHYMALEYLEGQSLRAVRKHVRDLSIEDGLRIVSDVLQALAYAHALCDLDGTPLGIVHRDMSPENVFLTYDRRVVLLDFGVAKAADGGSKTEVGKLKGRIRYMAPEQVLGAQVDGRADVFAVGILLWELITNARFWEGVEEVTILRRLLEGEIPRLPEGVCSPRLAAVCARALAAKPEDRFATAEEFRAELDAAALELGTPSTLQHLSRRMSQVFAESRERVNALVERERGHERDDDAPLPSVAVPLTETSKGSGSGARSRSLGSSPAGVLPIVDPLPPAGRSSAAAVLGVLAVVAVVAGFFVIRPRLAPDAAGGSPPTSAGLAPAAVAGSLAVPVAATVVELVVDVSPENAQVTLDGVVLAAATPYRKRLERDDKPHELEISAPGHETRKETVVLNGNVNLRLALSKVDPRTATAPPVAPGTKKRPGSGAASAEPTTTAAPPATGAPIKGGIAPKRDINTANPYGN